MSGKTIAVIIGIIAILGLVVAFSGGSKSSQSWSGTGKSKSKW